MSEASLLLKARWVFPVDRPLIEDGIIEVRDGRISRIGSGADPEAIDLGKVAIIPGLVNAHTHLEFSDLTQPLDPPIPFEQWIRTLVKSRRQRQAPLEQVIRRGLLETAQSGTTLVGEIATSEISTDCPDECTPQMVAFREVLGLDEATIQRQQTAIEHHLNKWTNGDSAHVCTGLSPHAPYSVRPDLFQWTIDRARQAGVPVAIHLAETREELELLQHGTGSLARMLRDFGLWQDGLFPGGQTVMDFLEPLADLDRVLVIHGNYLSDEEIQFLETMPQFSVVYCPRTHAYFGHAEHPWRTLLDRGILVALGTDSRASNPDLNLWREVQFLRASAPDLSDDSLLKMATIHGAKALGLDRHTGTLTPGKSADLAIVAFDEPDEAHSIDSARNRLLHPRSRITATLRAGRWLHGRE